jgi:hypothetical protein
LDKKPEKCRFCATAKHRRTPIPKLSDHKEDEVGGRINIDVSYVISAGFGGARYWLPIQDKKTDHIWNLEYLLKKQK